MSLYKITNREQVEEEEKETHPEKTSQVKTESSSSDSEDEGTKKIMKFQETKNRQRSTLNVE